MELIQHWPNIWSQTPLHNAKGEIRLLVIYNDPDPKMVDYYFEHLDLDHPRPFYAMSYAWGQPGGAKALKVGKHTIMIRSNVDDMLRDIRRLKRNGLVPDQGYPDRRLRLWVDMLCINQLDDDEKSQQVSIMGRIFRDARMTLAWLGYSTVNLERTIDAMVKASAERKPVYDTVDLGELKALQYWSRLWVVQEVGLSQTIKFICGGRVLSYEEMFHYTVDLMAGDYETATECFDQFAYFNPPESDRKVGEISTASMHMLTRTFGRHQCSDPRDRIYALHSLCRRYPLSPFTIDYKKSTTEVFLDFCYSYAVQPDSRIRLFEISLVHRAMGLPEFGEARLSQAAMSRYIEFSCVSLSFVEQVNEIFHYDEEKGLARDTIEEPQSIASGCYFLFVCHTPWWIIGQETPADGFRERPVMLFCEYKIMPGDFLLVLNEAQGGQCCATHRNGIVVRTIAGACHIMRWSEICELGRSNFCTTPKKGLGWFHRHRSDGVIRVESFLIRTHENRYTSEEHARIKGELRQRSHIGLTMNHAAFLDFVQDDLDESLYTDSYGILGDDDIAREMHRTTASTQEMRLVRFMDEAVASADLSDEGDIESDKRD